MGEYSNHTHITRIPECHKGAIADSENTAICTVATAAHLRP